MSDSYLITSILFFILKQSLGPVVYSVIVLLSVLLFILHHFLLVQLIKSLCFLLPSVHYRISLVIILNLLLILIQWLIETVELNPVELVTAGVLFFCYLLQLLLRLRLALPRQLFE